MKKIFKTTMAFVAAVSLLSLAGCQKASKEDINPTYDGETVKTQFNISLPGNLNSKMATGTVQEGATYATFRGMQDIKLIPYSNPTVRTTRLGANVELGANEMLIPATTNAANSIPNGKLLQGSNSVLYGNVSIPLGTAGFLFYGKATGDDGYANGALTPAGLDGETSGISFTPVQIMATPVTTKGDKIATYLTSIANAQAAAQADPAIAALKWENCADASYAPGGANAHPWYNEGLGKLYSNFILMTAGASSYTQAAVQDLYTSIKNNTDKISLAVKAAILNATYASDAGTGVLTFTDAINNYPAGDNNSMPEGVASIAWDGTEKEFVASTNSVFNLSNPGASAAKQPMDRIVYPASLYYYASSAVKVSNTSRKNDYVTTNDWDDILAKYTNGAAVSPSTRSVVIEDPIQYAVGRLDTRVAALTATNYYDRFGEEVKIPTAGFELTGVLIGGQKPVDWKFEQKTDGIEYAIYDNAINTESSVNNMLTASALVGPNYTLALETAAEQQIFVVLEFQNGTATDANAADFRGIDGVVKKGCKFYMVAQLNPTADVESQVSGVTNTGKKVFKQDFKTIANFTIAAGSQDLVNNSTGDGDPDGLADTPAGFANAYVTIPDLRTPKLELGFSVDLTWQEGITFNYTF